MTEQDPPTDGRPTVPDDTVEPLHPSYASSRAAFLDAAHAADATIASRRHPGRGPDGEELFVDIASLGPSDATDVVLVVSGTHGVEGYCGSALQTTWLRTRADRRPDHVRVLFLHALNPHGFAWVRRVNEDNVDLNRNFVDWDRPPPPNPEYGELADLVVPAEWTPEEQERTTLALLAVAEERGWDHLQRVISSGQYDHPTGVFHGGRGPVWSHRTLVDVLTSELTGCERLSIIDLHTGLGPWGHGELITHEPAGSIGYERATTRWDEVHSMTSGESVSAVLQGDWLAAVDTIVPHVELTAVALEFGTVDLVSVMQALRADAWLHAHGDPTGPDAAPVRAQVRAAFADDDPRWIATVWRRFDDVAARTLAAHDRR